MLKPNNLRRFARTLVVVNAVILALLLLMLVLALHSSRQANLARARQAAENLANTLSLAVGAEIRQVDIALRSTSLQLNRWDAMGKLNAAMAAQIADEEKALVPQVDTVRWTDTDGLVLNAGGAPAISIADREYFQRAREKPNELVISEPIQGRIIKKWGVALARARVAADGSFKGVVYANLANQYFVDLFDDLSVGPKGAVTLRMQDSLKLIARYSATDIQASVDIGTSNVSTELKEALAGNPEGGYFVARTVLDGIERVSAYRRVPGYPMLLLVGLSTDDFYVSWRNQALVLASLTSLLAMLVVGASILFYKRHAIQVHTQKEIARLAAEREALLQSGLVGMTKVKNRVSLWHNHALSDIFGYGPDELNAHPTRMLYPDDSSYAQVGKGYSQLAEGGQYRTQLQMLRKDKRLIWIDLSGTSLPHGESLWMMVDISAVKEGEMQARHMAQHDSLTGLANRMHMMQAIDYALRDAERNSRKLAVCYLDLDGFKAVNDQHGHEAGDLLLREVARRMVESVRGNDLVARMGGDEFVILLNDLSDPTQLDIALRRLLGAITQPVDLGHGVTVTVGASIGVALYPGHASQADVLLRLSDQAMYDAKRGGKNRFHIYSAKTADGATV